ncbi:MAG TPA: bifunctional enoyl-CoA hydratase/phosphate acetyltransferase, partial [Bacteroidales bacterium]|nr:bifunctional enoyl-CoA hydratase/phosphate acetyltransferase [Bacteroidales bacterium]
MELKSLSQLVDMASGKGIRRLVVAVAQDEDVLKAVSLAMQKGLIVPVLVGNRDEITQLASEHEIFISGAEIVHEPNRGQACITAVKMIRAGQGDVIMKGMVSTGQFVKAILDKEYGLLKGGLLSHVAFFESSFYHKILGVTDAALNIAPELSEKVSIVQNAISVYHKLGIMKPLIAILAPVETVNPKIESTVHAAMLTQMQKRNQLEGCIIDGPLALDNAVSFEAAKHKGLVSDVAGNADLLVAPDLNAGNMLYKSLNFLGGAVCAAIVAGASVPIVLTSRADEDKSKF